MTRRARLVVGIATIACGPESGDAHPPIPLDAVDRYLEVRCDAMFRCPCEATGHVDRAMCSAAGHDLFDTRFAALREHDAVFDRDCFAAVLEWWRSASPCAPAARGPYCVLARGDGEIGDPCATVVARSFTASTCRDDLQCRAGSCAARIDPTELGEGASCRDRAPTAVCAAGLSCNATTGSCTPVAGPGDPCGQSDACDDDSWCEPAGTCAVRAAIGEPCSSTPWDPHPCARASDGATSYCVDGRCLAPVPDACGPWL